MAKKKFTADMFQIASFDDDDMTVPAAPAPIKPMTKSVSKKADPEKLLDNPLNRFSMLEDEDYESLLAGIEKDGFKTAQAIEVKPADENGYYVILSGHRRKKAAIEKGINLVPIVVNNEAAEWSVVEEIGYLTRANDGARQKNAYSCAAMTKLLFEELKKQGTVEHTKLVEAAMKYFNVKQSTQYNYSILSTLPDHIIEWGTYNLLTRDEGIFLAKKLEEDEATTMDKVRELENAYEVNNDFDSRRTAFSKIIEEMQGKKKKPAPEKEVKIDTLKTVRKAAKLFAALEADDVSFPRKKKNLDELIALCDEMEERIKKIRSRIAE